MCGRFVSADDAEVIAAAWEVAVIADEARSIRPSWNIPPTAPVRVIVQTSEGLELHGARWGLLPRWVKEVKKFPTLFNARSETIETTRSFAPLVNSARCVVVASGYYEWQAGPSGKVPMYIQPAAAQPAAFAGLYSWWQDPAAGPGAPWQLTATVITRAARPSLAGIHDREAIMLSRTQALDWLGGVPALPFLADTSIELQFHPVGARVGNVAHNDPELIAPVTPPPGG